MIPDIVYALCALVALFIPMGLAWAIVRWTTKRHVHGDAPGRSAPMKLHPLRHSTPGHSRRRVQSDTHKGPRSA